jgi:AraC family transcriptional regulator, transcriptional activator of pobA
MEFTSDAFPAEVHYYNGEDSSIPKEKVSCSGYFFFIYVRSGILRAVIDGNKISCTSNELVVALCRHYYQVHSYNKKMACYFVKVRWQFITDIKMSGQFIELLVSKQSIKIIHYYYETATNPKRFPQASFTAALSLLIFQAAWQRDMNPADTSFNRKELLTMQFLKLLIHNYREHHSPEFFAKQLFVTSGYLTKAVREVTGKTVIKCITEVLISEAKYLLMSSQHSIETISEQLHFNSSGSFSRFFKRQTATTPMEYRKEYGK